MTIKAKSEPNHPASEIIQTHEELELYNKPFLSGIATSESLPGFIIFTLDLCGCKDPDCKEVFNLPICYQNAYQLGVLIFEALQKKGFEKFKKGDLS